MKQIILIAFVIALYSAATAQTQKVIYTCSMHPEVELDKSGNCPKCGMKLIKKTIKVTAPKPVSQNKDDKPMQKERKVITKEENMDKDMDLGKHEKEQPAKKVSYTCEMHPEVHSDKPGNCSKCGMKLVKEKPQAATPNKEKVKAIDMDKTDSTGSGQMQIEQDGTLAWFIFA